MDPSYNNGFGSFGNGVAQQPPSVQPPSVQQPSNAQQDIILTPSSEKKPKKWLVVAILLLVGLGLTAGVVALVMWKGNVVGGGNAVEDFKELVSYIEDVPEDYDWSWLEEEDEESQEREWIYAVLVFDENLKTVRDYYSELNVKYERFLNGSGKRLPAELLEEYKNTLIILENAMNYELKREELFAEYDKGGLDGALEYAENKLKCSDEYDDVLDTICSSEMSYYSMVLEKYIEGDDGGSGKDLTFYINGFSRFYARSVLSKFIKKMNLEILEKLNA